MIRVENLYSLIKLSDFVQLFTNGRNICLIIKSSSYEVCLYFCFRVLVLYSAKYIPDVVNASHFLPESIYSSLQRFFITHFFLLIISGIIIDARYFSGLDIFGVIS